MLTTKCNLNLPLNRNNSNKKLSKPKQLLPPWLNNKLRWPKPYNNSSNRLLRKECKLNKEFKQLSKKKECKLVKFNKCSKKCRDNRLSSNKK